MFAYRVRSMRLPFNQRPRDEIVATATDLTQRFGLNARDEAMRLMIAETPATTLAGLMFKAKYAAAHCEGAYDAEVMTSIVDDLLAIEG